MHLEVERLDYKVDCLKSVYDAIDAAVSELESIQLHSPLVDTSDILSSLREKRLFVLNLTFEARRDLFAAYCKHEVKHV